MRSFILFLLGVFNVLSLYSQIAYEWNTLPTHNSSPITIEHIYDNGDILAKREIPLGYVISTDDGRTWQEMYDGILRHGSNVLNRHMKFREDHHGDLYFHTHNEIFKLTFGALDLVYESNTFIEDFEFLKNGNIAVAEDNSLRIIDVEGTSLNSENTWHGYSKILVGEDGFNYIVEDRNSHEFRKFNDDLSEITDAVTFYLGGSTNVLSNGRLFSGVYFSDDDGESWTEMQSELFSKYSANLINVQDENVLIWENDKLFLSKDFGNTFEELTEGSLKNEALEFSTWMKGSTIAILGHTCLQTVTKISHDLGATWTITYSETGYGHATKASADLNGNVIMQSCDESFFLLESDKDIWRHNTDQIDLGFDIYVLYDDTFIKTSEAGISKSYDGGKTWDLKIETVRSDLRIKDGLIVGYNKEGFRLDNVIISHDNGESWIDRPTNTSKVYFYTSGRFDILNTEKFAGWTTRNTSGLTNTIRICDFELEDCQEIDIPNEEGFTDGLAASFNSPNFYVLVDDALFDSRHAVYFSPDEGVTFEKRPVPFALPYLLGTPIFKIDRYENLYLGFENKLYISNDQGMTWVDISQNFPKDLQSISDVSVGLDDHIYVSNSGRGLLKSQFEVGSQIIAESMPVFKVNVFVDENQDCLFQDDEQGIQNIRVVYDDKIIKPTNLNGNAFFFSEIGEKKITLLYNNGFYDICEVSYTIVHDGTEAFQEIRVPLQIINECIFLESNMGSNLFRRCFESSLGAQICNQGSVSTEQEKVFIQLDPYFDFLSASIPFVSQEGQLLEFETEELDPGKCMNIKVSFEINCEATFGQMHCAKIYTEYEDKDDCFNGLFTFGDDEFCMENVGSYDPNDKKIIVNSILGHDYVGEDDDIEYLIRFQNTGTDTAFTVKVEDYLSPKFDYNTVRPVAASHDYDWRLEGGKLEVIFEDIRLVDSTSNEPASHGFVKFKVELKEGVEIGESLENEAAIYFDFNDPIITNLVTATFDNDEDGDGYYSTQDCDDSDPAINPDGIEIPDNGIDEDCDGIDLITSSSKSLEESRFNIFPIPSSNYINLPTDLIYDEIHLYSMSGVEVTFDFNFQIQKIDVSRLPTGCYFIKIKTGGNYRIGKFVKM